MKGGVARAIGDLVLAALVVAGAVLLIVGAAELPPPRFEPLGSAALPRILGAILILLAAIVAVGGLRRILAPTSAPEPGAEDADVGAAEGRPLNGALVLLALVTYVAALDLLQAPFVPATTAFLGAVGLVLGGTFRAGAVYALLGLGFGAALSYVFSTFLYVTIG